MENPERFTGYSGPSAAKVWDAIYNENCFNVAQKMQLAADCEQCSLDREAVEEDLAETVQNAALSGISFAQNPLSLGAGHNGHGYGHQDKPEQGAGLGGNTSPFVDSAMNPLTAGAVAQEEEMCLEKRVFYRMISGLHASISIHICDEYFNQTSGVWVSSSLLVVSSLTGKIITSSSRNQLTTSSSVSLHMIRAQTWNALCLGLAHTRIDWKISFSTTRFWSAP